MKAKLTRPDGSVLELEGTPEEVAAVMSWERPGPPAFTIKELIPVVVPVPQPIPGIIPTDNPSWRYPGSSTWDPAPFRPFNTCRTRNN